MKITVYSNQNCGPCVATKTAMKRAEIEFTEASASNVAEQLRSLGFSSAPVVIVQTENGPVGWSGFRPDLIRKLEDGHAQGTELGPIAMTL
ncbi:glutaredoxin domain-containing protein [Klebsiella sp. CN_Kp114]|uniref:glutaredoxin domain-containing protein n=1 Tax=unclassified Klebsiella TaxID=2608929 RepID=UPI0032B491EB